MTSLKYKVEIDGINPVNPKTKKHGKFLHCKDNENAV